jgi:hypothetical protein
MKIKLLIAFFILLFIHSCINGEDMKVNKLPLNEKSIVEIYDTAIIIPLGYFAIVKKDTKICAVKFLETGRHPKKSKRYAIYEYYYQEDIKRNFLTKSKKHGTGKATYDSFCIIGRLCFNNGNLEIECGEIHIKWYGGNSFSFGDGLKNDETEEEEIKAGVQIAPTKWTDINDVNIFDERLKWYKYDTKRENKKIPVEELW